MRTAVLFFGEIRGNKNIWENIYQKVVVPNKADVFMHHVYYEKDYFEKCSPSLQKVIDKYYREDKKEVHLYPPKELLQIFHPKKILLEERPSYDTSLLSEIATKLDPNYCGLENNREQLELLYTTIINQSDSRKKVLELKTMYEQEQGFTYDTVIMTRLDISIYDILQIDIPPECIYAKKLLHATNCPIGCVVQIMEQIIMGPSKQMDVIGTFIDHAPLLYLELCNHYSHFRQNEHFLAQHLHRNNIIVMNYEYPLDYFSKNNVNGLKRSDIDFVV